MDNLTNIKNIVEKQLKTNPKLRDSDSKLVATIWYNSTHIKDMSALDLLKANLEVESIKKDKSLLKNM